MKHLAGARHELPCDTTIARAVLVTLLGLAAGCDARQPARTEVPREAVLFVAASLGDAIDELRPSIERASDLRLRISLGSSSTLATQIAAGADADIFLSASTEWADYLSEHDLAAERCDLLSNRLVVVVPRDGSIDLMQPADLERPEIQRIAIADPQAVPAGQYAKEALTHLGLWAALADKLIVTGDVRQTLLVVERGEVDAGIVYATDAAASSHVSLACAFPAELSQPIRYVMVLVRRERDMHAGRAIYEQLRSAAARDVYRRLGFIVLEQTPAPARSQSQNK